MRCGSQTYEVRQQRHESVVAVLRGVIQGNPDRHVLFPVECVSSMRLGIQGVWWLDSALDGFFLARPKLQKQSKAASSRCTPQIQSHTAAQAGAGRGG